MSDRVHCHSDDVTRVFVDTPDTQVGSTIMIDGKCYMKTGITGGETHKLDQIESYSTNCEECASPPTPTATPTLSS